MREHAEDLRNLLAQSSIIEQRAFLQSFVEKIEAHDGEVRMYYTIPLPSSSAREETVGVMPIVHHGKGPGDGASTTEREATGEVAGVEANDLEVTCYSGHAYAQRPVSLRWRGRCYRVREIEREWRQPGERCFLVQTECGKRLKLCYNEAEGHWSVTELPRR